MTRRLTALLALACSFAAAQAQPVSAPLQPLPSLIVSEDSREYLWVLARQPALTPADDAAIKARLQALGFDLGRVQAHPHTAHAEPALPTVLDAKNALGFLGGRKLAQQATMAV